MDDFDYEPDPDYYRDLMIDATTDWDRIEAHKPLGAKGYAMSSAELRGPCERLGCTCRWSKAPEGMQVTVRGRAGVVCAYPADWQPFPGWVPVQFHRGGMTLTRISDIAVSLP